MAVNGKDFLKKFFNILRLHDMQDNDYERWVRFEDFVSKNNMTDNMKKWAGYLEKDPINPTKYLRQPAPDGFFKIQDYPNIDDVPDEDLEQLYLACQTAFDGLKKNRDAYIDNAKVYNFINNFYDTFSDKNSSRIARPTTKTSIDNLVKLLKTITKDYPTSGGELQVILRSVLNGSLENFIQKAEKEDYNKNDEFQSTLKNVAESFTNYGNDAIKERVDKLLKNIIDKETDVAKKNTLQHLVKSVSNNRIADDYGAWTESHISNTAKDKFKLKYSAIFKELYSEQKVFDAFKQYEGSDKQVSAAIEKTKTDMDYANPESKDFVSKKREEELTLPQQIRKWASNTYEGYFDKYSKFKGDRIFMDASSGDICKALDKAKIKPTDGLAKIIENEKNIQKSLQDNVNARGAFEWFISTLKELQSDSKMSKAFEGALKSGRQMKSLVKEIIIIAAEADDPKVTAKAKIALEVLSVIKYGNTTSNVMDAIKGDKDLFSLMSNKDLSWNKNEGVKFVTTAIDKTIRAAFIGAGYGATFIWNNARKLGSKFNQKFMDNKKDATGQRMKQASDRWDADHVAAKAEIEQRKANTEATRTNQIAKRDATGIRNDNDLDIEEKYLEKRIDLKNVLESKVAPINAELETYNEMLDMVEHIGYLDWQKSITKDPEISKKLSANQADILAQLEKYEDELTKLGFTRGSSFDISTLGNKIQDKIDDLSNDPTYNRHLLTLNKTNDSIYSRQEAINKYKKATAEIQALDETIKKDEKKINSWDDEHKNVYEELMAYWDFLETGRDSHTGPLYTRRFASAKKNQARLNPKAMNLYNKFRGDYHAA